VKEIRQRHSIKVRKEKAAAKEAGATERRMKESTRGAGMEDWDVVRNKVLGTQRALRGVQGQSELASSSVTPLQNHLVPSHQEAERPSRGSMADFDLNLTYEDQIGSQYTNEKRSKLTSKDEGAVLIVKRAGGSEAGKSKSSSFSEHEDRFIPSTSEESMQKSTSVSSSGNSAKDKSAAIEYGEIWELAQKMVLERGFGQNAALQAIPIEGDDQQWLIRVQGVEGTTVVDTGKTRRRKVSQVSDLNLPIEVQTETLRLYKRLLRNFAHSRKVIGKPGWKINYRNRINNRTNAFRKEQRQLLKDNGGVERAETMKGGGGRSHELEGTSSRRGKEIMSSSENLFDLNVKPQSGPEEQQQTWSSHHQRFEAHGHRQAWRPQFDLNMISQVDSGTSKSGSS